MNLALSVPALAAAAVTFVVVGSLALLGDAAEAASGNPAARLWRADGDGWLARLRAARRLRLSRCGLATPAQRFAYSATAAVALLGAAFASAMLVGARLTGDSAPSLLAWAAVGALLVRRAARMWLEERRRQLLADREASLPLALEMLCIAVNGGLGLVAAWHKATDGLAAAKEPLAEELRLVELDVGLGRSWRSALEDAAARTDMASLRGLGQLLEQAERFGSELAEAIRTGVDSILHEEMQSLEERAHENSVKMLFPLAMCMLPATLVLVPGPMLAITIETLRAASAD